MASVGKIAPAVTRLLKNYKGAKFTLELPSRALADIGQANSTNVFGQAVSNIAGKYPRAVTTLTGEIGDQFISASASMKNGEKVVGEMAFSGDARIVDAIRDALFWRKSRRLEVIKSKLEVCGKRLQTDDTFIKSLPDKFEGKVDKKFLDRVLEELKNG